MAEARIGVVTVTYNSVEVLPDFLRCLRAQTHTNWRLYAIDNASSDRTLEVLHSCEDARVAVIANPDNRGVAEGNNQGIRAAQAAGCSHVLLINNDTEFDERLIAELLEGLASYACDMTCPKMLYYDEPKRIWAAGGYFQPQLGYRCLHYGKDELDRGQFDEPRQVTYVPTCCVMLRREVFDRIGLMDAKYFAYVDDTDFMYRAFKAGQKLYYLPASALLHKVGRLTGGAESDFSIRYGSRNHAYFQLKHFGRLRGSLHILLHRLYYLKNFILRKDDYRTFRLKQLSVSEAFGMLRTRSHG